MLRNLEIWVSA